MKKFPYARSNWIPLAFAKYCNQFTIKMNFFIYFMARHRRAPYIFFNCHKVLVIIDRYGQKFIRSFRICIQLKTLLLWNLPKLQTFSILHIVYDLHCTSKIAIPTYFVYWSLHDSSSWDACYSWHNQGTFCLERYYITIL